MFCFVLVNLCNIRFPYKLTHTMLNATLVVNTIHILKNRQIHWTKIMIFEDFMQNNLHFPKQKKYYPRYICPSRYNSVISSQNHENRAAYTWQIMCACLCSFVLSEKCQQHVGYVNGMTGGNIGNLVYYFSTNIVMVVWMEVKCRQIKGM